MKETIRKSLCVCAWRLNFLPAFFFYFTYRAKWKYSFRLKNEKETIYFYRYWIRKLHLVFHNLFSSPQNVSPWGFELCRRHLELWCPRKLHTRNLLGAMSLVEPRLNGMIFRENTPLQLHKWTVLYLIISYNDRTSSYFMVHQERQAGATYWVGCLLHPSKEMQGKKRRWAGQLSFL